MRAILVRDRGGVSLADLPDPEPGPGEVLIDVRVAGICRTDIELSRGYMDFEGVPGHEFVGTVREASSRADRLLVGARVTGEINLGCDECRQCAEGMARHCARRKVLGILGKNGAFAERLTLPASNLHVVPEGISDRQAVFIEPTAAAFEILEQIMVGPSQTALVLGDGKLGLIVAQVLATRGCPVTVGGRHEHKLVLARGWGMETFVIESCQERREFDLVVEATGSPSGLDAALRLVRPRGTVVMKSTCAGAVPFDAARAVVNELSLVGSRCGRFRPAIEALGSGAVKVDELIVEEFPLGRGEEAFRRAGERGVLKVLLRVSG